MRSLVFDLFEVDFSLLGKFFYYLGQLFMISNVISITYFSFSEKIPIGQNL